MPWRFWFLLITFNMVYVMYGARFGWREPLVIPAFWWSWITLSAILTIPAAIIVGIFRRVHPVDKYVDMDRKR